MASFRKITGGKWRAEIARKGNRASKVFDTKQAARDWASQQEYAILHGPTVRETATFAEVMGRYAREVSPLRRGERWEVIRLAKLSKYPIAAIRMADLVASDFAGWRDARLREVKPSSVSREMTLMSSVMSVARKEWGLIDVNPMADVRKPSKPPPRDRLVTAYEMEAMQISAGDDLNTATARAFHAFRFSCATAMRAGEVVKMEWQHVDLEKQTVHLPMTKNGTSRDVPLSSAAVALLRALPHADPVFGLTSAQLDPLFRKLRDRAGVVGLTYHDSRAAALTMLSQKVSVLDLARISGHKNINMLMVYYRESTAEIAKRLD